MATPFDDVQKLFKDHVDAALKSADAVSRSLQALASESTDVSKKSFEDSGKFVEKLMGVKTVEAAIELQTEFARKSYETAVGQATRLGEFYTDIARELVKPYEGLTARFAK